MPEVLGAVIVGASAGVVPSGAEPVSPAVPVAPVPPVEEVVLSLVHATALKILNVRTQRSAFIVSAFLAEEDSKRWAIYLPEGG